MQERDFEQFFKANERRIHYQIHRLGIFGSWYDEFYSEGVVALWKAYKEFDESKGAEIGTFINFQVRFRLVDLLRKKLREQELLEAKMEEKKHELDDGNRHRRTGMPAVHASDFDIDIDDSDAFWQEIRRHLSEKQWKWVIYFVIADLSIKEIMELEDVSADTVKSWGKAVRGKLRNEEMKKRLRRLM